MKGKNEAKIFLDKLMLIWLLLFFLFFPNASILSAEKNSLTPATAADPSAEKNLAEEEKRNSIELIFSYEHLTPKEYQDWESMGLRFYRSERQDLTWFFLLDALSRENKGLLFNLGAYKDWTSLMYTYSSLGVGTKADFLPKIRLDNDFNLKIGEQKNLVLTAGATYIDYFDQYKDTMFSTGVTLYLKGLILGYRIFRNQSSPGRVISFSHILSGSYGLEGDQWTDLTLSFGKQAYLSVNLLSPRQVNQDSYTVDIRHKQWLGKYYGVDSQTGYTNLDDGYEKYRLSLGIFLEF